MGWADHEAGRDPNVRHIPTPVPLPLAADKADTVKGRRRVPRRRAGRQAPRPACDGSTGLALLFTVMAAILLFLAYYPVQPVFTPVTAGPDFWFLPAAYPAATCPASSHRIYNSARLRRAAGLFQCPLGSAGVCQPLDDPALWGVPRRASTPQARTAARRARSAEVRTAMRGR
jgi:hypothetical protein